MQVEAAGCVWEPCVGGQWALDQGYLFDVQNSAVGRAHEDWAVVVDIDDLHQEHCGAPEWGLPTICSHHGEVEPLIGLQWALCGHQARVHVHRESLWQRERASEWAG